MQLAFNNIFKVMKVN